MTPQVHEAETPTRIRLWVWFLVLGAISALMIVMCLPRRERARKVGEGLEPVDHLGGDRAVGEDGLRVKRVPLQPRFSMREPWYGGRALNDWMADYRSTNGEVAGAAAKVLYELGPDASPLIPQLAMLLTSSNDYNRAVRLLVNIGTNSLSVPSQYGGSAASAVPALESVAREDPDEQARRAAAEAIRVIVSERANPRQ